MGKIRITIGVVDGKLMSESTMSKATGADLSQALMILEIVKKSLIEKYEKTTHRQETEGSVLDEDSGK